MSATPIAPPVRVAAAAPIVGAGSGADRVLLRPLLVLSLAPFLGGLVLAAPPPFFAQIAPDLGVGVALLGQATTALLLFGAACTLVLGPVADRHGPRRPLVLGALAAAVSLLGLAMAPTYPAFLVAGAVGGIAWATLPALSMAVAGDAFVGDARRRAVGFATAALAGGEILALPLLSAAAMAAGWRAAMVAAGVVAALVAVVLAACLPALSSSPRRGTAVNGIAAYRPLLAHRPTARLLAATLLRAVAWIALLTYAGGFLVDALGLPPSMVGLAYALNAAGYALGGLAAGALLVRVAPRVAAAASNLVLAAMVLPFFLGIGGAAGAVALLAIAGAAGAVGWAAAIAVLNDESPAGSGATMALNGALFNLGAAAGGAVGGLVLAAIGYAALAPLLVLFPIAAAVLIVQPIPNPARVG